MRLHYGDGRDKLGRYLWYEPDSRTDPVAVTFRRGLTPAAESRL